MHQVKQAWQRFPGKGSKGSKNGHPGSVLKLLARDQSVEGATALRRISGDRHLKLYSTGESF